MLEFHASIEKIDDRFEIHFLLKWQHNRISVRIQVTKYTFDHSHNLGKVIERNIIQYI